MIKQWLEEYQPKDQQEAEQALREIMQEIALAGLQRKGFFDRATFYLNNTTMTYKKINIMGIPIQKVLGDLPKERREKIKAKADQYIQEYSYTNR